MLQKAGKSGKRVLFARSVDKKICALGLMAILALPAEGLPAELQVSGGGRCAMDIFPAEDELSDVDVCGVLCWNGERQAGLHQVLGGAMTFLTDLKAAEDEEQQRRNAPESSDEEYDEAVSERVVTAADSLPHSRSALRFLLQLG
jgi:hypothetical protein